VAGAGRPWGINVVSRRWKLAWADVCVHKARLSSSFVDTGNINKDQRAVVVPICGMRVDSTALREHTQIAAFDHAPDPFCDVLCRIFIIYIGCQ